MSDKKPHGGYRKPLTFQERQLIEKYLGERINVTTIAKIIGRSVNAVSFEVRRNKSIYRATDAQYDAERRTAIKNEKLRNMNTKVDSQQTTDDINSLQEQINILVDVINDLTRNKNAED